MSQAPSKSVSTHRCSPQLVPGERGVCIPFPDLKSAPQTLWDLPEDSGQ